MPRAVAYRWRLLLWRGSKVYPRSMSWSFWNLVQDNKITIPGHGIKLRSSTCIGASSTISFRRSRTCAHTSYIYLFIYTLHAKSMMYWSLSISNRKYDFVYCCNKGSAWIRHHHVYRGQCIQRQWRCVGVSVCTWFMRIRGASRGRFGETEPGSREAYVAIFCTVLRCWWCIFCLTIFLIQKKISRKYQLHLASLI
jgi:hypothetical protein